MVSEAGLSFPRVTGFAFRFPTKLCPGCGCRGPLTVNRVVGVRPRGYWLPLSSQDLNLSLLLEQVACQWPLCPPSIVAYEVVYK